MPPEQARGVVQLIDGRADLFAIGAMLCEILTGSPPYPEGRAASRRSAAEARLDEARTRLSVASPAELASLCLRCLDEQPAARPPDATEIADGIARSFANLEARARAAEVAAAREGERARHERRARRWTVAFAAAVIVSVLGGASAWTAWSLHESTRRQGVDSRASEALGEAARLLGQAETSGDPGLYAQALAAAERAQATLAAGEGSPAVQERAASLRDRARAEEAQVRLQSERTRTSLALLRRLEELRVPDAEDTYPFDPALRDEEYARAFEDAGLHPDRDAPAALAAELRSRGIAIEIASQLDEWFDVRNDACLAGTERLRQLIPLLDPDPARSRVRAAIASGSLAEFVAIARSPELAGCGAGTLHSLARALRAHWDLDPKAALAAFRAVHFVRPDDYPITVELARFSFLSGSEYISEGTQLYRLAQALRPGRATAFLELGWELEHLDLDYAEAAEVERRAIELQPESGVAHFCLGRALRGLGDFDGALAAQAEAARLMPRDIRPRKETAMLHRLTGALEQSVREYASLLEAYPQYELARREYAGALFDSGRLEDARAQLRLAGPVDDEGRNRMQRLEGMMLLERGACLEAAPFLRGSRSDPEQSILPLLVQGVRLGDYLDLDALRARLEQRLARDPFSAEAHCQLGALLEASGHHAAALVAFRTGHVLSSTQQAWRYPSSDWLCAAARRAAQETRLVELLAAHESPGAADDALELARMASRKGLHEVAARWFAELLEREPERATRPDARLEAACAALRCSELCSTSAEECARWRGLARRWLRDELQRRAAELAAGAAALDARRALGAWQVARELEGVREEARLASLPPTERAEWSALWSSADALSAEAGQRLAGIPPPR